MIDALDPGREGKAFLIADISNQDPLGLSWDCDQSLTTHQTIQKLPSARELFGQASCDQIKPIFSSRFANRPIALFQYFLSDIGRYYLKKGHARCFISSNTYKFIENMLYVHFKHLISTFMLLSLPSIVSAGDDILHCPGPCEPHKLSCRIWGDPHVDDFV